MPSKATKRLSKKEINNIIKEAEKKVEENIDTIERISPFYDFIQEREQKLAAFSRFSNDYQVKQILPSDPNKCNFKGFHTAVFDEFKELCKQDIQIQLGIDVSIKQRNDLYKKIDADISLFDAQNKYYMLQKIYKLDFISKLTKAIVMLGAYYSNDETESEYCYKMGELCFGQNLFDYATIKDKIEFQLKVLEEQKGDDIKKHMCYSETKEIKRLVDIGETFSVYRGVLLKPDEMIRGEGKRINKKEVEEDYKGRKEDGEEFYRKWNAGKGVSLSLSKETAYFFCDWNLKNKAGIDLDKWVPSSERYKELMRVPKPLLTREEWVESMTILTSSLIEATGMKPVVVELEINPKELVGANSITGEGELNILPENCKVKHYELVSGASIAKICNDTEIRRIGNVEDLKIPFDKDGITMLIHDKPIFADGSKVYEELQVIKDKLKSGEETIYDVGSELIALYKKHEIELPKNVKFTIGSPVKKTYFEWLKNPIKKLIEVRRKKPRSGGKGF